MMENTYMMCQMNHQSCKVFGELIALTPVRRLTSLTLSPKLSLHLSPNPSPTQNLPPHNLTEIANHLPGDKMTSTMPLVRLTTTELLDTWMRTQTQPLWWQYPCMNTTLLHSKQ